MSFVVDGLKMRASVRKVPPAVVPPMLSQISFADAIVAKSEKARSVRRRKRMEPPQSGRFYMVHIAKVRPRHRRNESVLALDGSCKPLCAVTFPSSAPNCLFGKMATAQPVESGHDCLSSRT